MQDLQDAIKHTQAAVNKTPSGHPNLPATLSNLGSFLNERYNRMGDTQDLEDAIKHTQAAVNKTPSDHPNLFQSERTLSRSLRLLYSELSYLS